MDTPVDNVSDAELVDRYVVGGDSDALGSLLERHAPAAYRAVLRIMAGNAADAEDAVQAGFVDVMKNIRNLKSREDRAIKGWILKVVMNTSKSWVRGDVRRKRREEKAVAEEEALQPAISPETAEAPEIAGIVKQYLEKLADHYRLPLWLHHGEGLSLPEVAEALSLPEGTVRSQVKRGLDMLKLSVSRLGYSVPVVALVAALHAQSAEAAPPAVLAGIRDLTTGILPASSGTAAGAGTSLFGAKTTVAILTVVAATTGTGIYLSRDPAPPPSPPPLSVTVPPPVLTASVTRRISLHSAISGTIQGIATDGARLWISGGNPPVVHQLNTTTGKAQSRMMPRGLFVGGPVAWDGKTLWLSGTWTNGTVRNQTFEFKALNLVDGTVGETLPIQTSLLNPVTFSGNRAWTLNTTPQGRELRGYDRPQGRLVQTLPLPAHLFTSSQPSAIAATAEAIWIVELAMQPRLYKIDPADGHVALALEGPWQWPTGLASDSRDTLWVISHHDYTAYRVDVSAATLRQAYSAK